MIYVVYKHEDRRCGGDDFGRPCGVVQIEKLDSKGIREFLTDKYGPDAVYTHSMYETTLDHVKRIADEALQIVADYNGYFLSGL